MAAIINSSLKCMGKSLSECTAMSASLFCNATSSSLIKRPLPPIFDSDLLSVLSPWVVMPRMLTSNLGYKDKS